MTPRTAVTCLLINAVATMFWQVRSSEAIPAFARREGARCQMCHFRLPELNEDGHAYVRRGLREAPMPMASTGSTDHGTAPSTMAAPASASMDHGMMPSAKPMDHGMMPSAKPVDHGMMPSGMADRHLQHPSPATPEAADEPMGSATVAATLRPLGEPLPLQWQDYLSVIGHHSFETRRHERVMFNAGETELWIGGPLDPHWSAAATIEYDIESGAVAVEQAYAQFNTSWSDCFTSVRVGQLMPFAVLFNGGGPSLTLSRPVVLKLPTRAGNPRTPMTFVRGVEVGVVNLPAWNAYLGAGQPEIGAAAGAARTDVYASAEYLLSGTGNAISGLGYFGSVAATPSAPSLSYQRVLLLANAYGPRAKGLLGVLWGSDRPAGGDALASAGGFALGEFRFDDRWAGYARYDHADREQPSGANLVTSGPALGVSRWMQTQVRLALETQFLKNTGAPRDMNAVVQLLWAF